MLQFRILPVTPYQQNCTLLWCDQTQRAVIVDPGGDLDHLRVLIRDTGVTLEKILLTHGHFDHVGAAGLLAEHFDLPIVGPHREDAFLLESLPGQCATFGFPPVAAFTPDRWLDDGDLIEFGTIRLEVIHCPGHTPGHVIFYSAANRLAQVGDVIFQGSIGRTDFPRGNHQDLISSIRQRLFPLGDDLRFIPGHGPMSTVGAERRGNPFVRDALFTRGNFV
ncbi:MAG: MBL fold metallo-hydrolase [Gammaproteobacteria bacterium]|jgi:glyoxylase-like metal-dependent hydrolase (beta-lactamase superfamily II)|nr:MBL fold metallo-hydrolase [Gammaproteobacteria bacterium]